MIAVPYIGFLYGSNYLLKGFLIFGIKQCLELLKVASRGQTGIEFYIAVIDAEVGIPIGVKISIARIDKREVVKQKVCFHQVSTVAYCRTVSAEMLTRREFVRSRFTRFRVPI